MKDAFLILAFLFGITISVVNSTCTFASGLQGTWDSPTKGQINITSTQMTGYDIYTYSNLTFSCAIKNSGRYILQSDNFTVLAGNEVFALICLKFTKSTSNVYTYFVLTTELADANSERVVFLGATTASFTAADACDDTSVQDTTQNTKLLVKDGTASSEAIQCPDDILGDYWYYNGTNINCSSSVWDGCSNIDTMTFDYTQCSTQLAYSASGVVNCIYHVASNTSTVLYVYNTDATVNATANSTYQYTCMVLEKDDSDGLVYVTMHPEECEANQTSTYVDTDGIDIVLSANITCIPYSTTTTTTTTAAPAEEEEVSNAGLIAGVVVALIVIAAVGIVVGIFIWKKKKVAPVPATVQAADKKPASPVMLQQPDGRETITPSEMSTHMQSRTNSHGKAHRPRLQNKIKAQPLNPLRVIPRPPSHHALKRVRDKTTETPKIVVKHVTLKENGMKREETFYESFNKIPPSTPKVSEAPPEMKLELPVDQVFSAFSRSSTTLSATAVQIDINSAKTRSSLYSTGKNEVKKPTTERKENKSATNSISVVKRKGAHMTAKSMKNTEYVKRANVLKGVKLNSETFKKNVKLVGRVTRKKKKERKESHKGKLKDVQNNKTEISAPNTPREPKHEHVSESLNQTKKDMPAVSVDVEDRNFFMCSNESDNIPAPVPETKVERQSETQNHRSQSPLVVKPMPAKHHKFVLPKFKNVQPPTFNFSAIVDKARKVSKLRTTTMRQRTDLDSQNKTNGSEKEQTALSSLSHSLKTRRKNQSRRKKVEMPALTRYARIPTLIDWVEYTNLLTTPSMQMQTRLNTDRQFSL